MVHSKHFLVIGNPENRRVQYWVETVQASGHSCQVVAYLDILKQNIDFEDFIYPNTLIRIESPGENFEVTKQLMAWGANSSGDNLNPISAKKSLDLKEEKGRIRYTRQWFLGFQLFLKQLQQYASTVENVCFINSPSNISLMFDKTACQDFLAQKNIPVPPKIGQVESYDQFQSLLSDAPFQQVFLKPNHGSTASGVLAYRRFKNKEMLMTTVELDTAHQEIKLYNSKNIKKYADNLSIQLIIDTLAKDGLRAERWIPKASNADGVYDFRIVTINGQARHLIARQSRTPITNLRLGNSRGNLELIKEQIGAASWDNIPTLATTTAQLFPEMTYLGMDILLANDQRTAMVVELNAFGDLLHHCWHLGETTYEAVWNYCQKFILKTH